MTAERLRDPDVAAQVVAIGDLAHREEDRRTVVCLGASPSAVDCEVVVDEELPTAQRAGVLAPEDVGEIVVERTPPLWIEGVGPPSGSRGGGQGEALGPRRDPAEPRFQSSGGSNSRDGVESSDAAGAQRGVDDCGEACRRNGLRRQHAHRLAPGERVSETRPSGWPKDRDYRSRPEFDAEAAERTHEPLRAPLVPPDQVRDRGAPVGMVANRECRARDEVRRRVKEEVVEGCAANEVVTGERHGERCVHVADERTGDRGPHRQEAVEPGVGLVRAFEAHGDAHVRIAPPVAPGLVDERRLDGRFDGGEERRSFESARHDEIPLPLVDEHLGDAHPGHAERRRLLLPPKLVSSCRPFVLRDLDPECGETVEKQQDGGYGRQRLVDLRAGDRRRIRRPEWQADDRHVPLLNERSKAIGPSVGPDVDGQPVGRDAVFEGSRLLVARGEAPHVRRLREPEAVPVERAPGRRAGVDLGPCRDLEDALEADALVADPLARLLAALGDLADRSEVVGGERRPRVCNVHAAELTLCDVENDEHATGGARRLGVVGVLDQLEQEALGVLARRLLDELLRALERVHQRPHRQRFPDDLVGKARDVVGRFGGVARDRLARFAGGHRHGAWGLRPVARRSMTARGAALPNRL